MSFFVKNHWLKRPRECEHTYVVTKTNYPLWRGKVIRNVPPECTQNLNVTALGFLISRKYTTPRVHHSDKGPEIGVLLI